MSSPSLRSPSARLIRPALLGATLAGALLAVASPGAGTALAHGHSTESGDAVGRPGFQNPAPGIRVAQALGDRVFNQSTPLNKALDDTLPGDSFHGYLGTPNYGDPTHGSNGSIVPLLNGNWYGMPGAAYDLAQSAGAQLPDEEGLSGDLIRNLRGTVTPGPGDPHGHDDDHGDDAHALAATSTDCDVLVGNTAVRAQGSC